MYCAELKNSFLHITVQFWVENTPDLLSLCVPSSSYKLIGFTSNNFTTIMGQSLGKS